MFSTPAIRRVPSWGYTPSSARSSLRLAWAEETPCRPDLAGQDLAVQVGPVITGGIIDSERTSQKLEAKVKEEGGNIVETVPAQEVDTDTKVLSTINITADRTCSTDHGVLEVPDPIFSIETLQREVFLDTCCQTKGGTGRLRLRMLADALKKSSSSSAWYSRCDCWKELYGIALFRS